MDALQEKLLDMLLWFHNFCEKNDLRYYVLGGTMLGAARHKGFIPWDDDVDVGMPRDDYNRFLEITHNKVFDKYIVEAGCSVNRDFNYGFSKVYDTSTKLIEKARTDVVRGIFLDVFPLDGTPLTNKKRKKHMNTILTQRHFLLAVTCAFRKGRKPSKNLFVLLGRLIPKFVISSKKIISSIEKKIQEYSYDNSEVVANFWGDAGHKEMISKDVFGAPKLFEFEGIRIYGVEKENEYLSAVYGDWKKLPPIDKQVSHHDFILLDLQSSYLDI